VSVTKTSRNIAAASVTASAFDSVAVNDAVVTVVSDTDMDDESVTVNVTNISVCSATPIVALSVPG
jgi:hypothetical protein